MVTQTQETPTPAPIKGLAVGRIVHYIGTWGKAHHAAIITHVPSPPLDKRLVQLAVFHPVDRTLDFFDAVPHDPLGEEAGTWHFPEYVP